MKTWPFLCYWGLNVLNTKLQKIHLTVTEILIWLNLNSVDVWDQSRYPCHLEFFPCFPRVISKKIYPQVNLSESSIRSGGLHSFLVWLKTQSFYILLHLPALFKCAVSSEAGECIIQDIKPGFYLDREDLILTWYGLLHTVSCCTYCTWRTVRVKGLPLVQSTSSQNTRTKQALKA